MLTGESLPMQKVEGSKVIGSTINMNRALQMNVEEVGEDTEKSTVAREIGGLIDKGNCCDRDDPLKLVLQARRGAIEKLFYFDACTEQSNEHPITKAIMAKAAEYGSG